MDTLVSSEWLAEHLCDTQVRVIDCRWILNEPGAGRKMYEDGHIPGSVFLDLDRDLTGKEGPGRHPIPFKRDFQQILNEAGLHRDMHVVVYDAGQGMSAARLWWLLRYYGHDQASVLDGGFSLWTKETRPVAHEVPTFNKGDFAARPKRKWVADKNVVDSLRDDPDVLLIDARSPERYRGEIETIDKRAGHIPGAKNLPFQKLIDPETGRFLTPEQLRAEFEKLDIANVKTIISYCGSGITACTNLLALKIAGLDQKRDVKLYEGSWSDWSGDLNFPIQTISAY